MHRCTGDTAPASKPIRCLAMGHLPSVSRRDVLVLQHRLAIGQTIRLLAVGIQVRDVAVFPTGARDAWVPTLLCELAMVQHWPFAKCANAVLDFH